MLRQEIKKIIEQAVLAEGFRAAQFEVEHPEDKTRGDYATNVALKLARVSKMSPLKIADNLKPRILQFGSDFFNRVEIIEPGFINFFISTKYLQNQAGLILKQKDDFGNLKIGLNKRVNVEFISANPTGPLHIGNARGGYCGDVLANVLDKAGYKVWREYYVNDRGRQIKFLQDTLNGNIIYKNEYTDELIKNREKDVNRAVRFILKKIEATAKRMGIKFDRWFYETELYEKEINKVINFLKKNNLTEESEGAVWFKSTKFGDDKDRVLIRASEKTTYEEETYLLSDIAYLRNKFERGFDYLIIFLGAEHHGYILRLRAAAQALGYDKDRIIPIVFQLVRLLRGGKEVRMSKRAGVYVAIDDLLDEVNNDAGRFFFLARSFGSHLDFDLDLAKKQSEKNPVFYVQYAHARICSILNKSGKSEARSMKSGILKLLNHPSELDLIKQLIRLPEVVEDTAKDYQVRRLPQYATDLAASFHQFYRDCRVISEEKDLTRARLSLVLAARIVLKSTLSIMGISVPEKM